MEATKPLFYLQDISVEFLRDLFDDKVIPLESMRQLYSAGAVVFGGGTDVDPELYGETQSIFTDDPDIRRDNWESRVFRRCTILKVPMIGICRGSQFLTVMNGGKLLQHTDHHAGNHHKVKDTASGELIQANSYHHQMMIPGVSPNHFNLIAIATGSREIEGDPEIVWWPDTKCLCIQGHPEWVETNHEYQIYCKNLVKRYILKEELNHGN